MLANFEGFPGTCRKYVSNVEALPAGAARSGDSPCFRPVKQRPPQTQYTGLSRAKHATFWEYLSDSLSTAAAQADLRSTQATRLLARLSKAMVQTYEEGQPRRPC